MKRFAMILILMFGLTGCSLLPRITFDRAGVTPSRFVKSKKVESCKGTYKLDTEGNMIDCSRGYKLLQTGNEMIERQYTFGEKVKNFFSNLAGWGLWGGLALLFFCPGIVGWAIGYFKNRFRTALNQTVKGVQEFRETATKECVLQLDQQLSSKQDDKTKDVIDIIRNKVS